MNTIDKHPSLSFHEYQPHVIREGLYGSIFHKDNESLFLRMELLTAKNAVFWARYSELSAWTANSNSRGILSVLVRLAGKPNCPEYEKIKEVTGFTKEEYDIFIEKAIRLKNKTNNKIADVLDASSIGSSHMNTSCQSGKNYIVYVTNNRNFSIVDKDLTGKKISLKDFIESYNGILITVGSDFSEKESFHNRGISRNPYWVFEEKYAGLSMLLHGFSGAVANKYFPEKKFLDVAPIGSMQCIIKKSLLPGDGFVENADGKKDLTDLEVTPDSPEGLMNHIKISALTRIYNETIRGLTEKE